jgi:signal transduction histidine kinase
MTRQSPRWARHLAASIALLAVCAPGVRAQQRVEPFQHEDTRALVALVNDAAALVRDRGRAAFDDFRLDGSRWREGERYVFVLAPDGAMLVHPDPAMEGTNQLGLEDVNGKPIIEGLIRTATRIADRPDGWYHYQWPVPGGLLPRWKSSYVRLAEAPSGERFIVGSGVYNDRMERAFVVDAVTDAVALIEQRGETAYAQLRDHRGPFVVKDTYVFVISSEGIDLVNPGFPNLEGRNQLDLKDALGTPLVREMLDVAREHGSGWVDYMWPRPGEAIPTQKSTFVSKAWIGDSWVLVGCGVYLADAPRLPTTTRKLTAPELMALVRDGAALIEERGVEAYPDFRAKGSKWFRDDTYFFTWTMDGVRTFHAADPAGEGLNVSAMQDIIGRPIGRMILDTANSAIGEGWVHYMYPEPGDIFPIWKSTFVKRVTFPSGERFILGSGIYNMQMDRTFIEDVVDRAATLVAAKGPDAFAELRDRTRSFRFMDTYVFVDTPSGIELVNGAQPALEGRNLTGLTDIKGTRVADEYIALAMSEGSGWVDYYWFKPGDNTETLKQTYVRRVQFGSEVYIVGAGLYVAQERPFTD